MTDVNESIKPVERPKRRAVGGQSLGARGIYLLPNLFTSAALFAGFLAIVQAMNGHFEQAAMAIFIAMVLDGLDGRVARMTNTQVPLAPSTTACPTWCRLVWHRRSFSMSGP